MIKVGNLFNAMNRTAFLPLALLLLAGCVTTPAERIDRNPGLFSSWPASVQDTVRAGKIAIGFTPDQVRMALGSPDRIIAETSAQGVTEIWIYRSHRPVFTVGVGVVGGGGSTRVGGSTMVTSGSPYPPELRRVIFQNGRVSSVEEHLR